MDILFALAQRAAWLLIALLPVISQITDCNMTCHCPLPVHCSVPLSSVAVTCQCTTILTTRLQPVNLACSADLLLSRFTISIEVFPSPVCGVAHCFSFLKPTTFSLNPDPVVPYPNPTPLAPCSHFNMFLTVRCLCRDPCL